MDNGNGGPANRINPGFEHLAETTEFNVENKSPEILPTPDDQQEKDPYAGLEGISDSLNGAPAGVIDPAMLGNLSLQASQNEEKKEPGLGEIVNETQQSLTEPIEEKMLGTDLNSSKFRNNGVTKELAKRLEKIEEGDDFYKMSIELNKASKESLGMSFPDRSHFIGGNK